MKKTIDARYIKNILRNYKWNKSRIRMLELRQLKHTENNMTPFDYCGNNITYSKKTDLDDMSIMGKNELNMLRWQVEEVEIMLESLDSRKKSQKRKLIEFYYIENLTQREAMEKLGLYDNRHFFVICNNVLNELASLFKEEA